MTQFKEQAERRSRLLERLPQDTVVILPASQFTYRNNDSTYPFRQNSDFYYLTGLTQPNHVLVLVKDKNQEICSHIFSPELNTHRLQWEGAYFHDEIVAAHFGLDQASPMKQATSCLTAYCNQAKQIYLPSTNWQAIQNLLPEFSVKPAYQEKAADLLPHLHQLRLIKSSQEIALIQKAADISIAAHLIAMQKCHPGMMEYQLEAEFSYACKYAGAEAMAYNPIVAGGNNACVLHYQYNNQRLYAEDLVLIDAGCEYQYYASDITRTYPIHDRFSPTQAAIYDLVLQAQQEAISLVAPGKTLQQIHQQAVQTLAQGLLDLGIVSGSLHEIIAKEQYKSYFMHGIGHSLGLDVHDPGLKRGTDDELKAGMVITIEPGIYIAANHMQVASQWRGIGVRIEDDILVTEQGFHNLTQALPKERKAVEQLMQNKPRNKTSQIDV